MITELEEYSRITGSHLKIAIGEEYNGYYHISGFSHPKVPVIASDSKEEIRLMEWGLIPFWVKDANGAKDIQNRTLNAVSETIFEKPSFKGSVMKHRCLVLVIGFYEWRDYNKKKYPYFVHLKGGGITCLGGITSYWTDKNTGEVRETFSIVTTAASPLMEHIHNTKKRMPLILEKKPEQNACLDLTLDKEQLMDLMKPAPQQDMEAWTISDRLNHFQRENTNVSEINDQVNYAELPPLA